MTHPTPLASLDSLAPELRALLTPQPDFWALLRRRLGDALPEPFNQYPPDALYLDQAPLTGIIARCIGGAYTPAADGQYAGADGVHPLPANVFHALQRFARQFSENARQFWRDALPAFWDYPLNTPTAPRARLAGWLQRQWRAQLTVREPDATLPAPHLRLAQDAAAGTVGWRAVLMLQTATGNQPLPGACVLAARNPLEHTAEPVLLSTLAWAMEGFASWNALHQELAERLEDDIQGPALLSALAPAQRNAALATQALLPRPFTGPLFEQLATNLIDRQRNTVAHAWEQALPQFAEGEFFAANDTLKAGLALAPLLSTDAIIHTHYVHLLEQRMPTWLKALNDDEMLTLCLAKNELQVATLATQAKGLITLQRFGSRPALHRFARQALTDELHRLGITLAPERILITTVSARATGPLISPINPAETGSTAGNSLGRTGDTIERVPRTRNLLELALENLSPLDKDYLLTATVLDDQGRAIAGLGKYQVRRIVRHANVGGSYQRYLQRQLRSGPQAGWRQQTYRALLRRKMHYEGLKAAYRGHLGASRALHPWIEALVMAGDTLAAQDSAGPIHAWQLMLRATPVHGVYLFGPRPDHQPRPVLVYAPGNPNGQHWTLFPDRQHMARDWLAQAAVQNYLIRRTALAEHTALRKLFSDSQAMANLIEARPINGDFFANAYRSETRLMMANADALSTSNAEVDRATITDLALTLIELLTTVLPAKATAALSLSRAIWAGVQFFQELDQGPQQEQYPLPHIVDFATHLLEATVALSTSPIMSKVIRRMSYRAGLPIPVQYVARNEGIYLRYRLEDERQGQVYEAQSAHGGHSDYYIEDRSGRRYEVLYDGEHWRVVDGRKPDALYKPVVKQNAAGDWEMVDLALWRGQLPDVPALLQRAAVPAAPGLAQGQPSVIDGQLYARFGDRMIALRTSLLPGRYTVVIPPGQRSDAPLTLKLRQMPGGGWQAKARQNAMSSPWIDLPWAQAI